MTFWKGKRRVKSYLLTIVAIGSILAACISVTETIWFELSELKKAGQTYSHLEEEMIEDRKKARLFQYIEKIE